MAKVFRCCEFFLFIISVLFVFLSRWLLIWQGGRANPVHAYIAMCVWLSTVQPISFFSFVAFVLRSFFDYQTRLSIAYYVQ